MAAMVVAEGGHPNGKGWRTASHSGTSRPIADWSLTIALVTPLEKRGICLCNRSKRSHPYVLYGSPERCVPGTGTSEELKGREVTDGFRRFLR